MFYSNQLYPAKIIHLFPQNHIEEWIKHGKRLAFKKNELITIPGKVNEDIYLLIEGNVSVFHMHVDGKECVLGLLSSRDFIDILNIFTEKESNVFSKALTDVTVIAVPKQNVRNVVEQIPSLAMALLNHFSYRLEEAVEILGQVAYGKVEERLVFLLKKLADPFKEENGWYPISVSITHEDMAGMVASTRETVTLLINKLKHLGIIRQYQNKLWIKLTKEGERLNF